MKTLLSTIAVSCLWLLMGAQVMQQPVVDTKATAAAPAARPPFVPNQICEADANFPGSPVLTFTFGTCVNPISSTTTSNVGAGHVLVISSIGNGATVVSVTCGASAATLAVTQLPGTMYICPNSPGGAVVVTVTYSSTSASYRMVAQEYSGAAASPLDGTGSFDCGAGCSGNAVAVGLTTTNANDTIVGWCIDSGASITPGTSPVAFTGRYIPGFAQITMDGASVGTGAQSPSCDNFLGQPGQFLVLGLKP